MFETLEEQIKIDEKRATTTQHRMIWLAFVFVLSVVLFSLLYFGILFLEGT